MKFVQDWIYQKNVYSGKKECGFDAKTKALSTDEYKKSKTEPYFSIKLY